MAERGPQRPHRALDGEPRLIDGGYVLRHALGDRWPRRCHCRDCKASVGVISKKLGLDEQTTAKAIDALLPAITGGLQSNLDKEGGAASLMGALSKGDHQKYLTSPETLASAETITDGDGILGRVLGNKDLSRAVAGKAAQALAVDEGIAKRILPVVATMVMGGLASQTQQPRAVGGNADDLRGQVGRTLSGGGGSLLGKLL